MAYAPDRESLGARPLPEWYDKAKLGIFVHWGLYSVPAFAEPTDADYAVFMRELTAGKTTADRIPYAEWYLNSMRVPGSPTAAHHAATYGEQAPYDDFRSSFDAAAEAVDFGDWAQLFAEVGARYVVMVTRHLDGYPLWPTGVEHPHRPDSYRSRRDLVGELTQAVRAKGMRMGLYYSGGMDWTFRKQPMRTITDLIRHQALGPEYARYAAAQWRELIDTYRPSILWNDMGWPAEIDPHEIMAHYYDTVDDGVVNDRWIQPNLPANRLARAAYLGFIGLAVKAMARRGNGIPEPDKNFHYDLETHEYATPATVPVGAWELTRGLGRSFGYNAEETSADTLTGAQLIHLFADVVAKGGNLLLNVGPDGAGQIPELQLVPLRALGTWLSRNADAIYDTTPWEQFETTTTAGDQVRFTCSGDTVFAIVLADQPTGEITLRGVRIPESSAVGLLGGAADLRWRQPGNDLAIQLPPGVTPQQHAYVLSITRR
ncbi:alpha-L-fucosidase [Nocardia cyriacigeorgica]|uniref:alpha-L-fucosidase n=1 Tax=Nocardia cyriacigeorgica TaxID=135487 RepID=UPI0013B849F9|nr:alpha-L-fucosidase [Nocardia cyriacigeorgica]NEW48440.1 alpha-L-fucosidase [Nocardia cyriacigeorgica]